MDPQHAMSYNLAEIWKYSINNAGGVDSGGGGGGSDGGGINESGLGLRLKRGQHFGQFGDNDPVSVRQRRGEGGAHSKKRRDLDDDLNKVVSTSGAATSNANNSDGDGIGMRMKMTGK